MSRRIVPVLLAFWLVLSPVALAIDPVELPDPVLQERYRALTHELRCMQCQNQSIADSPVSLAGDLRREVRELLASGKTDAEIREHLASRYGDFILFRPRFTAQTAWLWVTPVLLLLLGIFVALRIIRGRASLADVDPTEPDTGQDMGAARREDRRT
ncbi:MAG: cytochrome c-type biogenesis protein CcmH [Gammaproteobacteria bacterium]|jgi:cytochrome c-type biogenesis protein CcmH